MDFLHQVTNKDSICVAIDNDNKVKKHNLEAEKRIKKVEQDYLHTKQKYNETVSQCNRLCDEKRRAINLYNSAEIFISICNELIEKLQNAINKLSTTEETTDHCGKSLTQENMICKKFDNEAIQDFRKINRDFNYSQRKWRRIESRKAIYNLVKEVREKNKCKDKAVSNCRMVCNTTSHESLRKSLELEIKVLKKLIREVQRDLEEKLRIKQYVTNIHEEFKQKVKHLEEKMDHISGKWDIEKQKKMLGVKIKHDSIGTYPKVI